MEENTFNVVLPAERIPWPVQLEVDLPLVGQVGDLALRFPQSLGHRSLECLGAAALACPVVVE